jgi:hypothetical protein
MRITFFYKIEGTAKGIRVQGFNIKRQDNYGFDIINLESGCWAYAEVPMDRFMANDPKNKHIKINSGDLFSDMSFMAVADPGTMRSLSIDTISFTVPE